MPDWTKAMQQTFEYYVVDPGTWKDKTQLHNVESSSITREEDSDTLGSAVIDAIEPIDECYVRIYLVTIQNGVKERHPLATVLVQSPSSDFDGKVTKSSMDAYTPLLELKEKLPPIGYSVFKETETIETVKNEDGTETTVLKTVKTNIMDTVYRIVRENVRAPVVPPSPQVDKSEYERGILHQDFVASTEETWLKFVMALMEGAKYSFALDELGRVLFSPIQSVSAMQPVWTYDDGNSSILYSEISLSRDLYDIPNVVEVVYSNEYGTYHSRVVNDDSNSPVSTVNRGREILYRETSPKFDGLPTQDMIDRYAEQLLKDLSTVQCTLSYKHGYCGTRLGDCVRLEYKRAGLTGIKAKIISQTIKCDQGCPVSEKAVFTTKLWG